MTKTTTKIQSAFIGDIHGIKKKVVKKNGYGKIYWNCENEHYVISDDNIMYIIQKNRIDLKKSNVIFNKTNMTYDEWISKYTNAMFIGHMDINKYILFINDLYGIVV